ncbi:MAG: glycosyltransferase [Aeromonas sp.]
MNIALVVDAFDAGGVARVASLLANGFTGQGHQVVVVDLLNRGAAYPLEPSIAHWQGSAAHYRQTIKQAIGFLNQSAIDCVLVLSMGRLSVYFALLSVMHGLRAPMICCEHIAFAHHTPWVKALKKLTYWRYHAVALLTAQDKQRLNTYCRHSSVMYNPSPFSLSATDYRALAQSRETAPLEVLAIGHLIARKGFARLITLWAKWCASAPDNNARLTIVGEGPESVALQAQIAQLNLAQRVRIVAPTAQIAAHYQAAQLYVSTAYTEGLPMTFIEAMAHGLPIVSYDVATGPAELIAHDVSGKLINDGDEAQFIAALSALLTSPNLRCQYGAAAYQRHEIFALPAVLSAWQALFSTLGIALGAGRSAAPRRRQT